MPFGSTIKPDSPEAKGLLQEALERAENEQTINGLREQARRIPSELQDNFMALLIQSKPLYNLIKSNFTEAVLHFNEPSQMRLIKSLAESNDLADSMHYGRLNQSPRAREGVSRSERMAETHSKTSDSLDVFLQLVHSLKPSATGFLLKTLEEKNQLKQFIPSDLTHLKLILQDLKGQKKSDLILYHIDFDRIRTQIKTDSNFLFSFILEHLESNEYGFVFDKLGEKALQQMLPNSSHLLNYMDNILSDETQRNALLSAMFPDVNTLLKYLKPQLTDARQALLKNSLLMRRLARLTEELEPLKKVCVFFVDDEFKPVAQGLLNNLRKNIHNLQDLNILLEPLRPNQQVILYDTLYEIIVDLEQQKAYTNPITSLAEHIAQHQKLDIKAISEAVEAAKKATTIDELMHQCYCLPRDSQNNFMRIAINIIPRPLIKNNLPTILCKLNGNSQARLLQTLKEENDLEKIIKNAYNLCSILLALKPTTRGLLLLMLGESKLRELIKNNGDFCQVLSCIDDTQLTILLKALKDKSKEFIPNIEILGPILGQSKNQNKTRQIILWFGFDKLENTLEYDAFLLFNFILRYLETEEYGTVLKMLGEGWLMCAFRKVSHLFDNFLTRADNSQRLALLSEPMLERRLTLLTNNLEALKEACIKLTAIELRRLAPDLRVNFRKTILNLRDMNTLLESVCPDKQITLYRVLYDIIMDLGLQKAYDENRGKAQRVGGLFTLFSLKSATRIYSKNFHKSEEETVRIFYQTIPDDHELRNAYKTAILTEHQQMITRNHEPPPAYTIRPSPSTK